jgi:NADH dehydrogenase
MADMVHTKGKVLVFGRGENPVNFVSADDTAALVVRASSDSTLAGRIISIGGPDDVTFNRFAETLQDVLGTNVRTVHVPRPALRTMAVAARAFNRPLARMTRAAYVMDTQPMGFDASEFRREFADLPCTDLTTALKRLHRADS